MLWVELDSWFTEEVLAFQPFKENPFAAIREHLTNTIAREKAKKPTKKGKWSSKFGPDLSSDEFV